MFEIFINFRAPSFQEVANFKDNRKSSIYFYHIAMEKYKPTDATTNPSLVLAVMKNEGYEKHVEAAAEYAKKSSADDKLEMAADHLFVAVAHTVLGKA